MKLTPYKWQNRLIRIYRGKGVIKAFAGTGKTYASILLLKDRKYKKTIVAVPTRKLKNQWIEELKKHGLSDVVVETFHILSKERSSGLKCDILIVDECHRSTSPVFKRLYENITSKNILGLSATPNKSSLEYCGDVIIHVPLEDAQICDFMVYFHAIDLSLDERMLYDEYSEAIRRYLGRIRSIDDGDKYDIRKRLDSMIFKRRSLVYSAESRIPKAIELLKENKDKPTLVICKRIEQANTISKITNLPVYHSENTDEKALDDFQNDRISALLSVGMLAEGYDKRNIKCLIIVSTAITEAYHIQSIGRAVRLPDDAYIHILLARKTTDEKLLQFRKMYNHKLVGEFSTGALRPKNPWIEQYYISDEYSIDPQGRIFKRFNNFKQYYKGNIITSELEKLFNDRGGKFRITNENFVLAKRRGKIIPLGMLHEPLEKIRPTKVKPLRK
ncbi:MAG: DEAD/DEAH box helicase family protein [Thermoplasmatales archaeon]|nr:MAG: DEAD/DEAH box helicase family protein [Thermoplasmatales archaeon]